VGSAGMASYILSWDDSTNATKGYLEIDSNTSADTTYAIFKVDSVSSSTGYAIVYVTYVSGGTGPSSSEACVLNFSRAGDKGQKGDTGAADLQGNVDNNIVTMTGTSAISGSTNFQYNSSINEIGLKGGNMTIKGQSIEGWHGDIVFTNDVADADDNGIAIYGGATVGIAAGAQSGSNDYAIKVNGNGISINATADNYPFEINTRTTASQDVQMNSDLRLTDGKITIDQQVLTDASTVTWNASSGSNASVTLAGNRTLAMSGWVTGDTGVLVVKQDGTGGRTFNIDLSGNTVYLGVTGYTPSPGANAKDVLGVYYDGTNYFISVGYGDATTTGAQGSTGAQGTQGTQGTQGITGGTGAAFTATNLSAGRVVTGNSASSIIGQTSLTFSTNLLSVANSLDVGSSFAGSNTTDGLIRAKNDVVAYSTSDERLKTNIVNIPNAIDKIKQINGVYFDWIPLTEEQRKTIHPNEGHDIGVIAQEIEAILPEVVTTRDTGYKAVKYEKIVALLIEAIKEQQLEIEEIKRQINE